MLLKQYTWDFDPHGTNPDNLIKKERHSLTPDSGKGFHFFIPKGAPFYLRGLKVTHVGTGRLLKEGNDYQLGWPFELATRRTYMPVYGAISILDKTLNGVFEIEYQTIGGEYTMDDAALLELLSNTLTDPRVTTWEAIVDKPLYFAPLEHRFSTEDLVGMEDAIGALDRIRDAILQSVEIIYPSLGVHLKDLSNPHRTTKTQVGLGSVENFPMATDEEAAAGVLRNRYMSPAATMAVVAALSSESVAGHVADKNNPHNTTKAQVGLGNVDNFGTANQAQAEAGVDKQTFMTPWLTLLSIAKNAVAPLNAHIADKNNPHATTKAQVGLSNVDNFATASEAQAQAGTDKQSFMTPFTTLASIEQNAMVPLRAHFSDKNNPHGTTKAQVGLGNVDNFATATPEQALAGSATNLFITVKGVADLIHKLSSVPFDAHVADKANPHNTTKAQVGLGSVENLPVASDAQLDEGTTNLAYTTVLGVFRMVKRLVGDALTAHLGAFNNPHKVTKAQVGLSEVDNFPTASIAEAREGKASNRFSTPEGVAAYVKEVIPGLGEGVAVNMVNTPTSTAATPSWTPVGSIKPTEGNIVHFSIFGLGDQEGAELPVYVSMKNKATGQCLFVTEVAGRSVADQLVASVDGPTGRTILWVKSTRQRGAITVIKHTQAGTLISPAVSDIVAVAPPGAETATPRSTYGELSDRLDQTVGSIATDMKTEMLESDYLLVRALVEGINSFDSVRPTDLDSVNFHAPAKVNNPDGSVTAEWSFTLAIPTNPSREYVRIVIDHLRIPAATLRVSVDGQVLSAKANTKEIFVFEQINTPDFVSGTTNVKVECIIPKAADYSMVKWDTALLVSSEILPV